MPGLVLVDGGVGQLHAAAGALAALGITDQPLASIAKREEWIYVYGQEDEPIVLDRFSPVLHLVQSVRDEAHRSPSLSTARGGMRPGSARNSGKRPASAQNGAQTARALRQRRAGAAGAGRGTGEGGCPAAARRLLEFQRGGTG